MNKIITAENLTKCFAGTKAVENLSLTVRRSEIMGIVGPDGAGKTTLMRMLAGIYGDYDGTVTVLGHAGNLEQIKEQIGYMPQQFSLYQNMSLLENMELMASLYSLTGSQAQNRIAYMLHFTGLWDFRERFAGKLSGGMKQKLALAAAVLHEPQILLLDEPTTGVDPVARREFWQLLYTLNQKGMTIVTATPYMDEAALCHRILFMQQGRKLVCSTPQEIISGYPHKVLELRSSERNLPQLLAGCCFLDMEFFSDTYHIITDQPERTTEDIRCRLSKRGITCPVIREIIPSLEDAFILLTEKGTAYDGSNKD